MSLYQYLNRIRRLDALIRRKSTGTPGDLAAKLGISERWLYHLLEELKMELDCPIRYSRRRRSYIYSEKGKIVVGFEPDRQQKRERQGWQQGQQKPCPIRQDPSKSSDIPSISPADTETVSGGLVKRSLARIRLTAGDRRFSSLLLSCE